MILFYDEQGKVIGTVDGFGEDKGVRLIRDGKEVPFIDVQVGDPNEALVRQLEDPLNPLRPQDVKIVDGDIQPLTDDELSARDAELAQRAQFNAEFQAANPPRDLQAEIDILKAQVAGLTKAQSSPQTD